MDKMVPSAKNMTHSLPHQPHSPHQPHQHQPHPQRRVLLALKLGRYLGDFEKNEVDYEVKRP